MDLSDWQITASQRGTVKQPDMSHPQSGEEHFRRAWFAVPPYATFEKFVVHPDHLIVTYKVAGAARPISHKVSL